MIFFLALLAMLFAKVANSAASAKTAHSARLLAGKLNRSLAKPHGNYVHSEFQFGTIQAVNGFDATYTNPGGMVIAIPNTVNVYPNGAQNAATATNEPVIYGVHYLSSYTPTVGDVVLIYRGHSKNRSSRIVLGKLNGAASPYPLPLGTATETPQGIGWSSGPNALWGGPGAPVVPPASAQNGDTYLQVDALGATWQLEGNGWVLTNGAVVTSEQSSDVYTLQLTDVGTRVQFTSSATVTASLLPNDQIPFPLGATIELFQAGTGQVYILPVGAVTLQLPGGATFTDNGLGAAVASQYGIVRLTQIATNVWTVSGDVNVNTIVPTFSSAGNLSLTAALGGYALDLADSAAQIVTVPTNADVPFPIGTWFELCQLGAGSVTVEGASGVTLLSPTGGYATRVQYSTIRVRQSSTNTWVLSGDLTT